MPLDDRAAGWYERTVRSRLYNENDWIDIIQLALFPGLGLRIPCLESVYRANDRVYKSGDGLEYVCE